MPPLMHIGMSSSTHFMNTGYSFLSLTAACGTRPDGKIDTDTMSCSALAASILRSASTPSCGLTDMLRKNRSGYICRAANAVGAQADLGDLDAELIHLVDDELHGVGIGRHHVGHLLEHVLRGELHLLAGSACP